MHDRLAAGDSPACRYSRDDVPLPWPDRRSRNGGVQVDGHRRVPPRSPRRATPGSPGPVGERGPMRKVPRVDGALTVPPRVNASASQCSRRQPARKRPRSSPCRRCWPGPGRYPGRSCIKRWWARVTGNSPALATRLVVKRDMRSGWLRGSIYWVLLVLGSVCCFKTIIPDSQEHPLAASGH